MAVFSHAPGGNGASHCPTAVTPPAVNRRWQMGRWVWNSHDFWNPMCLLVGMALFLLIILHPKISLCWFILEKIKTITIRVYIHYYYLKKNSNIFCSFSTPASHHSPAQPTPGKHFMLRACIVWVLASAQGLHQEGGSSWVRSAVVALGWGQSAKKEQRDNSSVSGC